MKLVEPTVEIWDEKNPKKMVELAGRVCYKSEDKITDDSYLAFFDRMLKSKHTAMLEHGTVYLITDNYERAQTYIEDKFSTVNYVNEAFYITTNYRVIYENDLESDLIIQTEPTEFHILRYTVHFTFDIGVGRETTRHRAFSFAQESTRYCNYVKDKFGGECMFVMPEWFNEEGKEEARKEIEDAFEDAERHYIRLVELGMTAQQARCVLPLGTKSELVMTGTTEDWIHFFDLRSRGTTGAPHPDMKLVADKLLSMFRERGIEL